MRHYDLCELIPGPRFDSWQPPTLRYIALDVDGTISPGGVLLSDAVAEARAALLGTGIRVGAVTGRSPMHLVDLDERMQYDGPLVLHNGAEVWIDGEVARRTPLGEPLTTAVVAVATEHAYPMEIYDASHWYVSDIDMFTNVLTEYDGLRARPDPLPTHPFNGTKATIVVKGGKRVRRLAERLDGFDVTLEPHAVPTDEGLAFVNVIRSGVGKGPALQWLFAREGFEAANVMAVGDGPNDITMLDLAGTAVVMGQAGDDVKAHAHFVAPSVFDDGAAAALRFARQFA